MNFLKHTYIKYRHAVLYGLLSGLLMFLLKWAQWKLIIVDNSLDIYIGLLAVFFTLLGVWIASQLLKPKIQTVILEKEIYVSAPEHVTINETELKKLNLSNREYEVLQFMSTGKSNVEIASSLFLSVSTVKTHVSNVFVKMDVKNRTQAVTKAKSLSIIP